jgi:hypothetical protein
MRIGSVLTHAGEALFEGLLIALLVVGLMVGTTFAAKPTSSQTSTTTFIGPSMTYDANGNQSPNYMDSITFDVSTTATSQPEVGLRCYQGTTFVEDAYVSYFNSWLSPTYFTLGSTYWNPALDANCTARLFYYDKRAREHVLATLTFGVAP